MELKYETEKDRRAPTGVCTASRLGADGAQQQQRRLRPTERLSLIT